jgi:hypothetical protein
MLDFFDDLLGISDFIDYSGLALAFSWQPYLLLFLIN